MTRRQPTMGEMITTFTFLLFGLLLGLAAMAETIGWKTAVLATCSALSFAGALRFKLQALADRRRTKGRR